MIFLPYWNAQGGLIYVTTKPGRQRDSHCSEHLFNSDRVLAKQIASVDIKLSLAYSKCQGFKSTEQILTARFR